MHAAEMETRIGVAMRRVDTWPRGDPHDVAASRQSSVVSPFAKVATELLAHDRRPMCRYTARQKPVAQTHITDCDEMEQPPCPVISHFSDNGKHDGPPAVRHWMVQAATKFVGHSLQI